MLDQLGHRSDPAGSLLMLWCLVEEVTLSKADVLGEASSLFWVLCQLPPDLGAVPLSGPPCLKSLAGRRGGGLPAKPDPGQPQLLAREWVERGARRRGRLLRAGPAVRPRPSGGSPAPAQARTCLREAAEGAGLGDVRAGAGPGSGAALPLPARLAERLWPPPPLQLAGVALLPRPPPPPPPTEPLRCPETPAPPPEGSCSCNPAERHGQTTAGREPRRADSSCVQEPSLPCGGGAGPAAPLCRAPLASPPRLNGLCRCAIGHETLRMRSGATRGDAPAAAPRPEEPPAQLRTPAPGLERAIGARLRVLGDQFQREYAHREQRRPQGALWGHVSHFVFQLLGILYNLPAEGLAGLRPN
uniref:WAS/WASL-interacting protein family member 1-like n=1 Tax=Podarcis muralis TaxID=64176 RepID=UPI00109F3141|nr:WAS/WASL-interacting protein family member 1-like [Podarcis muralis]